MERESQELGIVKSYLYPSLVLFLLPALSFWFFKHAETRFDRDVLHAIERGLEQDAELGDSERKQALLFFREVPVSRMLASSDPQFDDLRSNMDKETLFHYATFRWMIRLALFCLVAGVAVFAVTGLSVLVSMNSQRAQYLSLSLGWHVLRIFCTLQVVAQACLLVALSFWITALWFEFYSVRLMIFGGLIAAGSVLPMLAAIFRQIDDRFEVNGEVLQKESATELWDDLEKLSTEVGADLPDQIIAGIDDNFFVTEHPTTVGERTYTGRTLFVSLSLLKKLQGREADAVLSHELAHFSGNDTLYSRKISPLLIRYQHYLEGLHEGVLSRPVFHCAVLFRALYEISLGKLSRQREFRADRIAAETTSPTDVASALLRTAAYSEYRHSVEQDLFDAQQAHTSANILKRIEDGFQAFAASFAERPDVGKLTTTHPFDSHPPLGQRLQALGFTAAAETMRPILTVAGDGPWFDKVSGSEELEQAHWKRYEEGFLQFHENVLAFRYLPSTAHERSLVEKYFPEIKLESSKRRPVSFDCEKLTFEDWDNPVYYSEIENITVEKKWGQPRLDLTLLDGRGEVRELPLSHQKAAQQQLIEVLQNYCGRYRAAAEYQASLQQSNESEDS